MERENGFNQDVRALQPWQTLTVVLSILTKVDVPVLLSSPKRVSISWSRFSGVSCVLASASKAYHRTTYRVSVAQPT